LLSNKASRKPKDFSRITPSRKLISGERRTIASRRQNMTLSHQELLAQLEDLAKTAPTSEALMEGMAEFLHEKMTRYNWVGFYLVDPANSEVLVIGPFSGSFTPNARIPLNQGLCGAAATSGQTVVVGDVSKDARYLAGSSLVKCEIVVPIMIKGKLAGELDIESYFTHTFPKAEQDFVEACARIVRSYLERS
jgi:L-methionine (R)-S-oxide reductase